MTDLAKLRSSTWRCRLRQAAILLALGIALALGVAAVMTTDRGTTKDAVQGFLLMCMACTVALLPVTALAEHGWSGKR